MQSMAMKAAVPDLDKQPPKNTMSNTVTEEGFSADARQFNPNVAGSFAAAEVARNAYSLEEQVIGTWIDGRPLYRKTIHFGTLPLNTSKNVEHGIVDMDKAVTLSGIVSKTDGSALPLPHATPAGIAYCIQLAVTRQVVGVQTGTNLADYNDAYVIIEYTKTTDQEDAYGFYK